MFTGIVQAAVLVSFMKQSNDLMRYALQLPQALRIDLKIGASMSVWGVCQTVVAIEAEQVFFEAIAETLRCTNLKFLKLNQTVNIERAARMGDEIGGHLLSGHVIGTGIIHKIEKNLADQYRLTIACESAWMKYILHKGFIALNGVSLTVQAIDPSGYFTVHLIPETLRVTTFNTAKVGESINIEIDTQTQAIVDTVERILATKHA
ncbi:MAG: riboflavin synthase subunit alpha [Proteobacteria bacterium]|nr:riboflavin synthase subunit alpha [Pseudomonadota bacterium]